MITGVIGPECQRLTKLRPQRNRVHDTLSQATRLVEGLVDVGR